MKKKNILIFHPAKSNQKIIDSYDYLSNAASAQDCTSLIPVGPTNRAELESYEEVYHYQPPKIDPEKCGDFYQPNKERFRSFVQKPFPYIYAGNYYYNMKKHRTSFVSFSTKSSR